MREPILKAVAVPVRVLWAPMIPALANVSIQAPILFFWVAMEKNPMIFMITLFLVHIIIVAYSVKEPHLSNMLKSQGPFFTKTKTMYSGRGNKLAP